MACSARRDETEEKARPSSVRSPHAHGVALLGAHEEAEDDYKIAEHRVASIVEGDLPNPFVTELVEAFQDKWNLYLVMPYYAGGELFHHVITNKRLPEPTARFVAAQVALGIAFLHHFNCLWRSCKPEDILVGADGYIAICDFGLGKILAHRNDTTRTFCVGSYYYISPEIITKNGHGLCSDWWGLGCLVYELVVGVPPFYPTGGDEDNIDRQLDNMILNTSETYPRGVSDDFKDLVHRLLAKDCSKRLGFRKGFEEIRKHPWFANIDWEKLSRKQIRSPLNIEPLSGIDDFRYFDPEFINDNETLTSFAKRHSWVLPAKSDPWRNFDWNYQSSHA